MRRQAPRTRKEGGMVLGVVALLSLRQVRRERRSLMVLRHLAVTGRVLDERSV